MSILCLGIQSVDLNTPSIQQAGGKHGNAGMGMEIRSYTTKDVGQPFTRFRFQSCFQSHQGVVVKLSYVVLCYLSGENYLWLVTWIDYEIQQLSYSPRILCFELWVYIPVPVSCFLRGCSLALNMAAYVKPLDCRRRCEYNSKLYFRI